MKYSKIFYTVLVAALLGASGCSKEKFDINSNPDDVTDLSVTPTVLLPGAQQATATNMAADYWWLSWWMGHGARSTSYQTLNEEETYSFTNNFKAEVWFNLYANANQYDLMVRKASASGAGLYEAIGRIMRSHNFQMLVDVYNNLPYSEAFKGTAIPTPKYDKGLDVYKGILADLDAAMTLLNDANATQGALNPEIATSDLMFGGNITMWKKFLNTLRLRVLVHLHNGILAPSVAPGINVATEMAKISAEGFLMRGENAHIQPGFSGTKPQPYYRFYNTSEAGTTSQRDFLRAAEYAIDYYKYDGDPRIDRFYVSPNGTTIGHRGIPFGTPSGTTTLIGSDLSTVRGAGLSPNGAASRAWILTATESLFLQAEARHRGFLTSGASADILLRDAIRESFTWLGVTKNFDGTPASADVAADNYIANNATYPDVDYFAPVRVAGQPGGGLFTILQQKWFALNTINPLEIWTDFRRTDIIYGLAGTYDAGPTLSVDPGRVGTSIPRRMFYPQNEYNYNAQNVGAEGTINVFTGKIFWDLN